MIYPSILLQDSSAEGDQLHPEHDDSGDTEILSDNEWDDSQCQGSESPTSYKPITPRTPEAAKAHGDQVDGLSLKLRRALLKSVFGRYLTREESVDILKKKFLVKNNALTSLTPSEITSVLIRKLAAQKYFDFKMPTSQITNIDDIKVLKEISLL